MLQYKILSDYPGDLEKEVNKYAAEGYVVDKAIPNSDSRSIICIIMVKTIPDKPEVKGIEPEPDLDPGLRIFM